MDQVPKDRVGLGSKFRVLDLEEDKETEFEIVMEGMGSPGAGLISITSPLARGFLNKRAGDEVTINVPSGKKTYEILDLLTMHDRERTKDA
jgi:transcription elongation factor GreA